ncbi:hypothetical protein FZEAL_9150 [Fusarium zealandicum]|uniref:Uncharacterized protein n=1 Tax=Fusarium zealandicum TaxID=1053134 RepID=A0A8H4XG52_9HYPO|nr:hypothetical protein FZEAL_9150 [Fusarium zealandicum]
MSLSRAFTARKAKMAAHNDLGDLVNTPHRSNSARDRQHPILRHKISAPIQLVHTTNMLSYNAPDIPQSLRSKSSLRSVEDSEVPSTAESTPPTSPDVSPVKECPGPEPNHLSTYFMFSDKPSVMPKIVEAPIIPKRSPSHTKQNSYDAIARHRSASRLSKDSEHSVSTKASFNFSRSSSTSTQASSASLTSAGQTQKPTPAPVAAPAPPPSFHQRTLKDSHPFGQELAQVTELAEEYGAKSNNKDDDEDSEYFKSQGLVRFTAEDYLSDVQSLLSSFFPEVSHAKPTTALWI